MSELKRIVSLLNKISELEKYKKMWENFWRDFDIVYDLLSFQKKYLGPRFREQLLYRKNIIEKEAEE
ncbi:hypothetical protein LCGC14_0794400 [marine sediment metagenome]|uniref:Uncharacterized protein n=1 Tax=marine sediment metagenome TaxID=412755 RepID=A0A0F9SYU0_9ZZZZ